MEENFDQEIILETTNCPLCDSSDYDSVVTTQDFFCHIPGEFTFTKCSRCYHVFLNPRPNRETIAYCYPDHYAPHIPSVLTGTHLSNVRPWYARPPIRWIPGLKSAYHWLMKDYGQILPQPDSLGDRALEVGSGRGAFLAQLSDAGWSVHGIEPSSNAAHQARKQGYTIDIGTLEEASFPEGHFQAIFAWMVLEHLISPHQALEMIHRWISPGGHFYFSVPNYGCLEPWLFGKHWFAWEAPRHLHQFKTAQLRKILTNAGFENIHIIHQRNIRDYYGSLALWLLSRNSESRLGKKLMSWFVDAPPLLLHVALAPCGVFLAMIRQGGRITVSARKPSH